MSPFIAMMHLFNEVGSRFPDDISTTPFYVAHGILMLLARLGIRRYGLRLRQEYLPDLSEDGN